MVDLVYGGMPPDPTSVAVSLRSRGTVRRLAGEPQVSVYRVAVTVGSGALSLGLQVLTPRSGRRATGGLPVVIDPDACWWNLDDASVERFLGRGVAVARFDRTAVVADPGAAPGTVRGGARGGVQPRTGGLYDLVAGGEFGALAAWAWGIQRVVDALHLLAAEAPRDAAPLDVSRVAITGFSRGGKAALLAGATDLRMGLVHAHASGAGGAAPFLVEGDGSEGMRVVERFPGWFGPQIGAYLGREAELPVDQHALLAAVMPRPLLLTCGDDDLWANPAGTAVAAEAAAAVARFLGRPHAVAVRTRPGGHYHGADDWATLLGFIEEQWL